MCSTMDWGAPEDSFEADTKLYLRLSPDPRLVVDELDQSMGPVRDWMRRN